MSLITTFRNPAWQIAAITIFFNMHATGQEAKPTISVTGEAEMQLAADEIVINASIESRAKTPAEACKDNREKSRLLLEFLKSQSIEEKMINADLLSIEPILPDPPSSSKQGTKNYQANQDPFGETPELDPANPFAPRRRAVGFTAFRAFTIVVKDLKKFEDIYQGIVEKGINRVDGVRYRSSQEKSHLEKLRLQAVRLAKERAQAMAGELGADLSAIKSIANSRVITSGSESGRGMGFDGRGDDPFGAGESESTDEQITLRSSVEVVFYLGSTEFKKQ